MCVHASYSHSFGSKRQAYGRDARQLLQVSDHRQRDEDGQHQEPARLHLGQRQPVTETLGEQHGIGEESASSTHFGTKKGGT